ncbi:unnamed protein product [Effrenium voratum]|uniref:PUM-HD domain-containing protein n=1 Tax=Effrenium voratum TaxID=2562239 RepID=A0AA36HQ00_9DINO|nr:unnamed protein product [Effrenium voratum]
MACEVMAIQEPTQQGLGYYVPEMQSQAQQAVAAMVVGVMIPYDQAMQMMQVQGPVIPPEGLVPGASQNQQWSNTSSPAVSYSSGPYPAHSGGTFASLEEGQWDKTYRRNRPRNQPKAQNAALDKEAALGKEFCDRLDSKLQGGQAEQKAALQEMRGLVWQLSRDALGCRLVQTAIAVASPAAAKEIAGELRGHVREAAASPHANYVLQKVISQLSPASFIFIAEELVGNAARFARHRYGCRIICRLLEYLPSEEKYATIVSLVIDELLSSLSEAQDLCRHNFGHHVAQGILEHGGHWLQRHKDYLAEVLQYDLEGNAMHRSASYLLESALTHCKVEDQKLFLHCLARADVMQRLVGNKFGIFVAKRVLERPEVDEKAFAEHILVEEVMRGTACVRAW